MSTMTLEQVRDWHLKQARLLRGSISVKGEIAHLAMADALDTHLRRDVKVPEGWRWEVVPLVLADMCKTMREKSFPDAAPTTTATDGQGGEG